MTTSPVPYPNQGKPPAVQANHDAVAGLPIGSTVTVDGGRKTPLVYTRRGHGWVCNLRNCQIEAAGLSHSPESIGWWVRVRSHKTTVGTALRLV